MDIPAFPFIADIYLDHIVIYFKGNSEIDDKKNHYPIFLDAIKEVTSIKEDNILYMRREVFDHENDHQYQKQNLKEVNFIVEEGELKFNILLGKYIDTGLFLDHRPLRQDLYKSKKDLKILNLFCYTGSLSVACAKAGNTVTSVDLSNTYIDWAQQNFKLNEIDTNKHIFVREDCFKYLENLNTKFDCIILDPPTFSNSKKMTDTLDIQRDQVTLVNNCMRNLNKDGVLYFSNNKRDFKLSEEIESNYKVKDKTFWSIPEDFRDKKIHKLYEISHH